MMDHTGTRAAGAADRHVPFSVEDDGSGDTGWSLYALAAALLKYRRMVLGFVLGGLALGVIAAIRTPPLAIAKAAFVPQSRDTGAPSGLAGLAARLGGGSSSESIEFYGHLLQTRGVLRAVAGASYRPLGATAKTPLYDIWMVLGKDIDERVDGAANRLDHRLAVNLSRETGIIDFSVKAEDTELARQLAQRLLAEVNEFNLRRRQSTAAAERTFVEARLKEASDSLAESEGRLERFLSENREYMSAPSLRFQYERLQRRVLTRQQEISQLTDGAVRARLDEVRNTPVITVIQEPWSSPAGPRFSVLRLILCAVAGGIAGAVLAMLAYTGALVGPRDSGAREELRQQFAGLFRRRSAAHKRDD